jgi:hypothetical protein
MAMFLTSTLAFGVISGASVNFLAQAVSSTISSIVKTVRYVTGTDSPGMQDVVNEIAAIDIEFTIGVLGEFIKESQVETSKYESVKKALMGVQEILESIDKELQIIYEAMELHRLKYVNSIRTFKCKCNIENLKNSKSKLLDRYNVLTNLLKIYKTVPIAATPPWTQNIKKAPMNQNN